MREGAPKPDISTPESFRATLLAARSVVHSSPATPSGAHLKRVIEQLGIADAMKDKIVYRPALDGGVELVAKGEAEIGMYPTSEVIHVKGVTLVGPLPAPLQLNTVYGAAVAADNAAPDPAIRLHPVPLRSGQPQSLEGRGVRSAVGRFDYQVLSASSPAKAGDQ